MGKLEMQVSAGIAGTDYAPLIQDAIDSLPASGGTIELLPGTFDTQRARFASWHSVTWKWNKRDHGELL